MPRNAIAMSAATLVLAPGEIGRELTSLFGGSPPRTARELARNQVDGLLLARYAPAAVVVDEAFQLEQFAAVSHTSSRRPGPSAA